MEAAHRPLARQHQARQCRGVADAPREDLIEAGGRANLAAVVGVNAAEDAGRAFGVSIADVAGMAQAVDEIHLVLDAAERGERRAKLQVCPVASGPPFRGMNTVAEEQEGEALWRRISR